MKTSAHLDVQQLALFDEASAPAIGAKPPRGVRPGRVPPVLPPAATASAAPGAAAEPLATPPQPAVAPELPAASIQSVLAPAVFRHPRGDREIRLHDHLIGYALKRVRRRSIGFIVGPDGLSVNAPKWVGLADIEAGLHEKSRWILKKLTEQRERAQRLQPARVDWRDGTSIPFLGEVVIIVLDPRATGAVLVTDALALPGLPKLTLHVGLPHAAAPEQIRDSVQSWLQRQARRIFDERCAHFAPLLRVRPSKISLSSAQTRWGSASGDGSIRLNWRLVHFAMPSIDYVVAHELAHLREMNHSPRFWDVVRSVMPDFKAVRGGLQDGVVPLLD